jgi:4-hydroxy-4-methyl-2-oxoglutarate aldolase
MTPNTQYSTDVIEFYRKIPTGYLTDVFGALGLWGWIIGLQPLSLIGGENIVGPAVTIHYGPRRGREKSSHSPYAILREIAPGSVVVVEGGGTNFVLWGENMSNAAMKAQVAGVIMDGYLRDVAEIRDIGLRFLYCGVGMRHPPNLEIMDYNVPVVCAGAQVHPGDLVVADDDGAIVIPPENLDEVTEGVKRMAELEKEQGRIIREGRPMEELRAVFAKKRALKS